MTTKTISQKPNVNLQCEVDSWPQTHRNGKSWRNVISKRAVL